MAVVVAEYIVRHRHLVRPGCPARAAAEAVSARNRLPTAAPRPGSFLRSLPAPGSGRLAHWDSLASETRRSSRRRRLLREVAGCNWCKTWTAYRGFLLCCEALLDSLLQVSFASGRRTRKNSQNTHRIGEALAKIEGIQDNRFSRSLLLRAERGGSVPEVSTVSFGALLRRCRRAANLTQESLAERAGISARSVSDLERGLSRAPHPDTIALLAEALALTGSERAAFLAAAHPQPSSAAAALELLPLPVVLSPLIAREREEAALVHLLQRDAVRLLTLTGPAGVGKTRLALQVARTARESFADGVLFVSLAAIREPRLLVLAIAQALGLQENRQQQAVQILIAALRERHMLLVLDNCEQVPGAAGHLLELLAHAPRLKVLATSRARWRIRGEQVFPLAPLAVPDLGATLSPRELEQYGAVALFLQRVRALQPDFQLSAAQAPVIAELCARLDGLPLAIELAAARFPLLPPQQLLDRLGTAAAPTALRVVSGQLADLPERHQSLRGAIGWSFDLLNEPEQRLFRRLSVFVGGAALEAILAVCADAGEDESQLLEYLEALLA